MNILETITFEYDGKCIEFFLGGDLLINVTEIGNHFNKRPVDFLELKPTIKLIAAMEKRPIGDFNGDDWAPLNAGIDISKAKKVSYGANNNPFLITFEGKENGGTWMHRWLAIDFAMWADVEFKLWLLEKIDYLFLAAGQSNRKMVLAEKRLLDQRKKLLEKHKDNDDFTALAAVIDEHHGLRNKKSNEHRKAYYDLKMKL